MLTNRIARNAQLLQERRLVSAGFALLYLRAPHQPPCAKNTILMTRTLFVSALTLISLGSATAFAADKGDAKAGKALVYTCGGCHGVSGYMNAYPNYHVPRIAGQNFDYLVNALTEYKKGERSHPTMRAQGESLSDADIRNIATYLSSISK